MRTLYGVQFWVFKKLEEDSLLRSKEQEAVLSFILILEPGWEYPVAIGPSLTAVWTRGIQGAPRGVREGWEGFKVESSDSKLCGAVTVCVGAEVRLQRSQVQP